MKDIIKIALNLTVICVAAAVLLGAVFAVTDHARKLNEEKSRKDTIESLLGYGKEGKKAPADLNVASVYRYVITKGQEATLGYLVPLKDKTHALVVVDVSGKPLNVIPIEGTAVELGERAFRDSAVMRAIPKGEKAAYAETFYIADVGGKRVGFVAPGVTQGFKTFIDLMVSMDPGFTVTGVEILKSEEDPGLGDEIKRDFFRNQFTGKTSENLKTLAVIKEPLPDEYRNVLDPARARRFGISATQRAEIMEKHLKDNIYALTGATISSRAVTVGVKETARKFEYRYQILTQALKDKNLQAAF